MKFYIKGDNGVMLQCDSIIIDENETLRVSVDIDRCSVDDFAKLYKQITEMFPKNGIIGLYGGMTLTRENEAEPAQLEYVGMDEYWGPWGRCPRCGHDVPDFDGFCSWCGVKIQCSDEGD